MKSNYLNQSIQSQISNQLNNQLNTLWVQINHKQSRNKKAMHIIKTQNQNTIYNRTRQSYQSSPIKNLHCRECKVEIQRYEQQINQLNEKLIKSEKLNRKYGREIQKLKENISKLLIDKQKLIQQIKNLTNLFQFSNTKNMQINIQQTQKNLQDQHSKENEYQFQYSQNDNTLQDNTKRLLQLLRSTTQYRQFSYYYQNNELSFLKHLNKKRQRNCCINPSQQEKKLWCPKGIIDIINKVNNENKLELNKIIIQQLGQKLDIFYREYQNSKIKKLKQQYQNRLKEIQRQKNSSIPYDIIQIQKLKQRQLSELNKKIQLNKKNNKC